MNKKILVILLLAYTTKTHALTIGPNLLSNSPSDYLIDLIDYLDNSEATQQIGNELFSRDYISTLSIQQQTSGSFNNPPELPGTGYSFTQGIWLWIPNTLNNPMGTWHWILRTRSYIMQWLHDYIVIF